MLSSHFILTVLTCSMMSKLVVALLASVCTLLTVMWDSISLFTPFSLRYTLSERERESMTHRHMSLEHTVTESWVRDQCVVSRIYYSADSTFSSPLQFVRLRHTFKLTTHFDPRYVFLRVYMDLQKFDSRSWSSIYSRFILHHQNISYQSLLR